jgi:hypothetical protein
MGKGEQIEIYAEEKEHLPPEPQRPAPPNRFVCHDCQDEGKSPLVVSIEYAARVEHLLEFDEQTGEYRLVKTIGRLDDDVTFYCCGCDFDVSVDPEEENRIAKAAGVLNIEDRVKIECDHGTGRTEIVL